MKKQSWLIFLLLLILLSYGCDKLKNLRPDIKIKDGYVGFKYFEKW